jgi:exonuclease III
MDESCTDYSILSWNVRGLNNKAKQEQVKKIIQVHRPVIVCLQETKLADIPNSVVSSCLGSDFTSNYCYLPADGTRGVCFWLVETWDTTSQMSASKITRLQLRFQVTERRYPGPSREFMAHKRISMRQFINELCGLKQEVEPAWLILGDFNLVYLDSDKNNGRLNRRIMTCFRRALNHLEVREIHLLGRQFTWSSGQRVPTMTRIDRAFYTIPWEEAHSDPALQALYSSASGHPLPHPLNIPATRYRATGVQV